MLQAIRQKITGWVAGVIILLIALSFVFWGVGDFGAAGRDAVAVVNGEEIPRREFEMVYQRQLFQLTEAFDGAVPEEARRQARDRVIEGLIQERLLAQRTEARGYRVPDDVLAQSIQSIDAFQVGGSFSLDAYRARLLAQGMTPGMFEEQQRRAIALDQLQDAIARTGFITPTEFRRFIELAQQRRELAWARFPVSEFREAIEPVTEAQIAAHYEANAARYLAPETVDLEYVEITLAGVSAELPVDDEALREFYQRTVADFALPEQRRARHILIAVDGQRDLAAAQARAQSLYERIEAGEDFAALAAEFSDDDGSAVEGGDLGWAERGFFVGPFEEALFELEVGEVSEPVETVFGFHVIRLDELREGELPSFEDMRAELREEFQRTEAENRFIDRANALADAAFETPDSLQAIAEAEGLQVQRLPGMTRAGSPLFSDSRPVVAAAFSPAVLLDGELSGLIQVDEEQVLLLRVASHQQAEVRPLEEVAEAIREELETDAAARLARETGAAFLAALRDDVDADELEARFGRTLGAPRLFSRQEFNGAPPALLFAAFELPRPLEGELVLDSLRLDNGDYAVFALTEVRPGDPAEIDQIIRDIENNRMASEAGFQEFALYLTALEEQARIRRRPQALEEATF
ncbi:MAG: SurA N-terminal domain-containing protein [Gammaproteobacteria bacterium]|nr:SurA N-terminal domain-containing protein [Gammaproteobacteria bacterium]TVQ47345.1 MAG: hypothetical protein EA371_07490 [Gammaproteobacteria bacterium]